MSEIKSNSDDLVLNSDGGTSTIKFQTNGVERGSISTTGAFTATTIDATALTGALPAISGASLTNLPAGGVDGIVSTANATAITIDSSERVGIHTTNPTAPLHIEANLSGATATALKISNNIGGVANTASRIEFHTSNAVFEAIDGVRTQGASGGALDFWTMTTGGSLTKKIRIQENGGISFNGDTAAANALDDYEEGTWTVALNGCSGGTLGATYVKVGNVVTCYAKAWGFTASAVAAQITGLPFASTTEPYVTGTVGANTWTTNGAGCWGYSASTLRMTDCVNQNEATGISGSPRYLSFSITYRTT